MDFSKKCAFITGAGRGIGRATAIKLAKKGANVVICDWYEPTLKETEEEIKKYSENVISCLFDVSDPERVKEAIERAVNAFGTIHILVNSAGVYNTNDMFVDSKPEDWIKKININILGTMYPTQMVLPYMLENKYGRIVNLASVAGVYGSASMADYSMTKGGIISFTKALAKEVTEFGITVNAVSPGNIAVRDYNTPEASYVGRSGTPDECAEAIVFLASDGASFISGQNYQVDGCRKKM